MWDTTALDLPIHSGNQFRGQGHLQLAQLGVGIRGIPHLPKSGRYGGTRGSTTHGKLRPKAIGENARDDVQPMFFIPMLQQSRTSRPKELDASLYAGALVLQMKLMTPGLEAEVRTTLASIDPNLTADHYQTFAQQIHGNFNSERRAASTDPMRALRSE